jgi:hypothetical protein
MVERQQALVSHPMESGDRQGASNRRQIASLLFYRADRRGDFSEQLMDRHVWTVEIGHGKKQQLPCGKPVYDNCLYK